jgi:hypothetical protein
MIRNLILGIFLTGLVWANDTSVNAAGDAPTPLSHVAGEESVIRMVSEKIDINFGKEKSRVRCRFVFRSTKPDAPATQLVGFPDFVGETDSGPILSMITRVDGKEIAAKKEKGWFSSAGRATLGKAPETAWEPREAEFHVVEVLFPPGKDVVIERDYTVANGGSVMGNQTFSYTTLTGGIWHGTIGKAEINVILNGWTIADLAFDDGFQIIEPRHQAIFSSPNLETWKVESPTKLSLVWENFEPAVHKSRQGIFLTTWVREKTQ